MSRLTSWMVRVGLCLLLSCSGVSAPVADTPQPTVEPDTPAYVPVYPKDNVGRINPHIAVKVDAEFSTEHRELILKAFQAWEMATSGKVSFVLTWDAPKPGFFKDHADPGPDEGIFMWWISKTPDHGTPELLREWTTFWGLMDYGVGEDSGNILLFKEMPSYKFYAVALHEIGHLLGMDHEAENSWSNLEPAAAADCITTLDAEQVCRLYHCNPKPGCMDPNKVLSALTSETCSDIIAPIATVPERATTSLVDFFDLAIRPTHPGP